MESQSKSRGDPSGTATRETPCLGGLWEFLSKD